MTLLRTALIWDINLTYQARVPKSEPTDNAQPNGSRFSCGRLVRQRSEQCTQSVARQGTTKQAPLKRERPPAASAC